MNLRVSSSKTLPLCLGLLLAAGCGSPKAAGEPAGSCQFDVDCNGGEVCMGGKCVSPSDGGNGPQDGGPEDAGPEDAGPPVPVTIPLTGCPFIGFQVPVTLGMETFQMSVDTGSTTTAVAGSMCTNCGVHPEYDGGVNTGKTTSSTYGSGAWNGDVFTDNVSVGAEMPPVMMDFGVMTSQQQFFIGQNCAGGNAPSASQGILGMGNIDLDTIGTLTTDAYFNDLVSTAGIPNLFAVELCSSGGNMWFGGYDPVQGKASGPAQYTPMVANGYYSVKLNTMILGTADNMVVNLDGSDPGAVVDTGTWGFYMPHAAYTTMTNSFASTTSALGMAGAAVFGAGMLGTDFFQMNACISAAAGMTQADVDMALPPLTMTMPATGGGPDISVTIPATQSYLVPITTRGQTCYVAGVGDNKQIGGTIMGASALRGYITIFDLGGNGGAGQVGFAPQTNCQ